MIRTQVQLDDELYEAVRQRAFQEHVSIGGVVRALLRAGLGKVPKRAKTKKIRFLAVGRSGKHNISENHDRHLFDDDIR